METQRVEVQVSEVQIGDKVHFPNSRRAKAVETIEGNAGSLTLTADDGTTTWIVPPHYDVAVEREVPTETEESEDQAEFDGE